MYEEKDYVMRIVHEYIRMIIKLIFGKDIDKEEYSVDAENVIVFKKLQKMIDDGQVNEAENLLTDYLRADNVKDLSMAILFYDYLNHKGDEFLDEHNYSREEIKEGLRYVIDMYGYGYIGDIFLEELE